MIRVERFDVVRNLARPGGRRNNLISGFPAEHGFIVGVTDTGEGVRAREHKMNRLLEVGDKLRVGPEILLGFAAPARVFGAAALPNPVVHERNDEPDAGAIGGGENSIERAERCLVKFPRREHMARGAGQIVGFYHRDDVTARDRSAHL